MKSNSGAPGLASSLQDFERKPVTSYPSPLSSVSVCGLTSPFGWLPALQARNRPAPTLFRIASAMIERAELPVQRNSTL
jgi:hypothetical protein